MMSLITAIILSFLVVGQSLQQSNRPVSPGVTYPPRDPEILYILYGFLIAAFAPKAVQKFAEQKLTALDASQAYRQSQQTYAGYLPPASSVVQQPPVVQQPVVAQPAAVAQQAPVVQPPTPEPPAPATPTPPTALQTVLQRGAL